MRLELVRISDISAEQAEWLFPPYIPLGALTLLEGDPESGKTYTAIDIAACVTTGREPDIGIRVAGEEPHQVAPPANVLYATGEDHLASTLKPRFLNCKGDEARFLAVKSVVQEYEGESRRSAFRLGNVSVLDQALREYQPKLVVIDPLQAFLGAGVDMHRANEVRPVLSGLAELAERHRCAVLIVRHLNKAAQQKAAYRGMGSIDITGAARSVLLAAKHPHEQGRFALVQTKNNLGTRGPALVYSIDDEGLHWHGREKLTADDLLSVQPNRGIARSNAVDLLKDILADGPKAAATVQNAAREGGISVRALKAAKDELGVIAAPDGKQGQWYWSLPANERSTDEFSQQHQTDQYCGGLAA
ncbi:MAG TPA: AAA family ATPase [Bryobacteraceae bacterium]|nr:AAA family ATPase [Bryobacteraceae bacterium]